MAYLGFPVVPSQALLFDRAACLAKECCLARGPGRDPDDTLFAARLYGAIADISVKVISESIGRGGFGQRGVKRDLGCLFFRFTGDKR